MMIESTEVLLPIHLKYKGKTSTLLTLYHSDPLDKFLSPSYPGTRRTDLSGRVRDTLDLS